MDYEYTISILADISTIIYCFFVIVTILQVRKSRLLANKPLVVCKIEKIHIENDIDNKMPIYFNTNTILWLYLTNIGNGCAVEININWKYDYKKLISIMKILEYDIKLYNDEGNKIFGELDLKIENGCPLLFVIDEFYEKCDYILKFDKGSENIHVEFPRFYLMLYTIIMNKNDNKSRYNIPPLFCDISYQDIENKKYSKRYRFKFKYNITNEGADIETIML